MLKASLNKWLQYAILIASSIGYLLIAYFIPRHHTSELLAIYTLLFSGYVWFAYSRKQKLELQKLLVAGILFRLIFILAFPMLSDDIYRFVWDGRLLMQGIHPFAELPTYYMHSDHQVQGITKELFDNLNSQNYFTIYPPFAQFVFWLSVLVSNSVLGSAIFIRILILLSEAGSIYLMVELLKRYKLNTNNVLLYVLNPLIIIELSGNLHFEAFMIFFLLLSLYSLQFNAIIKASVFMAASIASKLLPLMLLPLFIRRLKQKPLIKYYLLTAAATILFFAPLFDWNLISGMSQSISLYFQKFEFNASIYYLIREIGFTIKGYNIIQTAGKFLAAFTFIMILIISFRKPKEATIFHVMLGILTIYLVMATTVHPWYLATILALTVFTQYRYAVVWSFLVFFTYAGYSVNGFTENYTILIIEYLVVFSFLVYEWITHVYKKPIPKVS